MGVKRGSEKRERKEMRDVMERERGEKETGR